MKMFADNKIEITPKLMYEDYKEHGNHSPMIKNL